MIDPKKYEQREEVLNEILAWIKKIGETIKNEGFDALTVVLDKFCNWIDHNKWFYIYDPEESQQVNELSSLLSEIKKSSEIERIIEGQDVIELLALFRTKQEEYSPLDLKRTVLTSIVLNIIDRKFAWTEKIPDESYFQLLNEVDRIAKETPKTYQNIPVFGELVWLYFAWFQDDRKVERMKKIVEKLLDDSI